jgi:hypothetical protein
VGNEGYANKQAYRSRDQFKGYSKVKDTIDLGLDSPNADKGPGEYQQWINIDKTKPPIYIYVGPTPGGPTNAQGRDGTDTESDIDPDDIVKAVESDMKNPKKDPKIKVDIMNKAQAKVNRNNYPEGKEGDKAYKEEVKRVYNEAMNK